MKFAPYSHNFEALFHDFSENRLRFSAQIKSINVFVREEKLKTAIMKSLTMWSVGAFTYGLIEISMRGYTHISMGVLGGICLIIIDIICEKADKIRYMYMKMLICAVIITALEFVTGIIVNVWLELEVWDYSELPLDICGQVCPLYFGIWYILSFFGVAMSLIVRQLIFKEEKIKLRIPVFKRKSV